MKDDDFLHRQECLKGHQLLRKLHVQVGELDSDYLYEVLNQCGAFWSCAVKKF